MMTELVSVSFLWVLSPRRSLIFQHLGNAINHKHQEVPYMGKGGKTGKKAHQTSALERWRTPRSGARVPTAGSAPTLLADIRKQTAGHIFRLVSMRSIFRELQ